MSRAKPKRFCKDCVREAGGNDPATYRDAPHPGPRCATHHRVFRRGQRDRNHAATVARNYGLERGDYESLYEFQGGRCALCKRATGRTRRLSVDHDHATGLVRGLLCRPCNDLLGHARDDVSFFVRCAAYLALPPAKALGLERRAPDG